MLRDPSKAMAAPAFCFMLHDGEKVGGKPA
jgi:hypothetical protein